MKFGTVIHEEARKNGHFYIIQSSIGNVYKIIHYIDPQTNLINNNVEVVRNGHTVLLFYDQELRSGVFTRTIGRTKYYCTLENGVEFNHTVKDNKFIKNLNKEVQLDQNIITLDLETYQFKKGIGNQVG